MTMTLQIDQVHC